MCVLFIGEIKMKSINELIKELKEIEWCFYDWEKYNYPSLKEYIICQADDKTLIEYHILIAILQGRLDILEDEHLWLKLNYDVFDDLYCENEKIWKDRIEQINQEIQKIKEVLDLKGEQEK